MVPPPLQSLGMRGRVSLPSLSHQHLFRARFSLPHLPFLCWALRVLADLLQAAAYDSFGLCVWVLTLQFFFRASCAEALLGTLNISLCLPREEWGW